MPRIERNLDIEAPVNKVFEILNDTKLGVKWNLAVNEIEELGLSKYYIKSNVGDFFSTRIEIAENEKISMKIERGIFNSMGYILASEGANSTNVMIWSEFEDAKNEKLLANAGELVLKSLKNYVEYIEEGGDPDSYYKTEIAVTM